VQPVDFFSSVVAVPTVGYPTAGTIRLDGRELGPALHGMHVLVDGEQVRPCRPGVEGAVEDQLPQRDLIGHRGELLPVRPYTCRMARPSRRGSRLLPRAGRRAGASP